MKRLFALAAVLCAGCALLGSGEPPALSAAEAYRAAVQACARYMQLPGSMRTQEGDDACAELGKVCAESATSDLQPLTAPPPAYGNKVMAL